MARKRKGQILLEAVIAAGIIAALSLSINQLLVGTIKSKQNIQDRIEISQQMQEIEYQIRKYVKQANDIISIKTISGEVVNDLTSGNTYNVSSIKLKLKSGDETSESKLENYEIIYKKNYKKIFLNDLTVNNYSNPGGYEIGDYVESLSICLRDSKLVQIEISLKKNKESLNKSIEVYMRSKRPWLFI